MRARALMLACLAVLAACSEAPRSTPLANDNRWLSFAYNDGLQYVSLCSPTSVCTAAPDGTYMTKTGTKILVRDGLIRPASDLDRNCQYVVIDGKEHIQCRGDA